MGQENNWKQKLTADNLVVMMENSSDDLQSVHKLLNNLMDQLSSYELPGPDDRFDIYEMFQTWKENLVPCFDVTASQIDRIARDLNEVAERFYWENKPGGKAGGSQAHKLEDQCCEGG